MIQNLLNTVLYAESSDGLVMGMEPEQLQTIVFSIWGVLAAIGVAVLVLGIFKHVQGKRNAEKAQPKVLLYSLITTGLLVFLPFIVIGIISLVETIMASNGVEGAAFPLSGFSKAIFG